MPLAMWDIKEGIMEVENEGVGGISTQKCLVWRLKTSPKKILSIKCPVGESV